MTGAALCRAQAVRRESPDPNSARRRGPGAGANLRFTPRRAGRPAEPSGRLPGALNGAGILPRIRHSGNAHVCGPGRPAGCALHGVRRGAAAFDAPGSRTGSGPPRRRPQRTPRCRGPQPPGARGKAGGAHAPAVMPARRGAPCGGCRHAGLPLASMEPTAARPAPIIPAKSTAARIAGAPRPAGPPHTPDCRQVPTPMGAQALACPAGFRAAAPPTAVARLPVYGLRGRERPREAPGAPARPEPAA